MKIRPRTWPISLQPRGKGNNIWVENHWQLGQGIGSGVQWAYRGKLEKERVRLM